MGEDLEARGAATGCDALGIDCDDDALRAELLGRRAHQAPVLHRRRVDGDLVSAGFEQRAHVVCAAHTAADGERHEAALRRAADHVEDGAALLVTCGDVEEAELVGPRLVIGGSGLDGVAGIPEIDEVDALDDAALFHVEAGYDADFQHDDGVIAGPAQPLHAAGPGL